MEYSSLKLIHLLAVMMFLGNIITGLFWMHIAMKTKDLKIISFTMKGIIRSDRYFTIPGVIIITAGGIMAAVYAHFPILKTGWIFWSIILFSISGLIFSLKLAPLQKKIHNLVSGQNNSEDFNWNNLNTLFKQWDAWGITATITPLAAFVMMVLKLPH